MILRTPFYARNTIRGISRMGGGCHSNIVGTFFVDITAEILKGNSIW